VLMDVQMPEMDGLEATRAIRAQETGGQSRIPIIAMTAQAMKGDRERCLEAGMDDYLTKPVRSAQLYETIARVVGPCQRGDLPVRPAAPAANRNSADHGGDIPSASAGRAAPRCGICAFDAALKAVDGDTQLLSDLARIFLIESPRLIGDIEEAIEQTDAPLLRRAAHTIKGGLRLFGAESAYEVAARLEDLGHSGDVRSAESDFATLKRVIAEIQRELSAFAEVPLVSKK